VFPPDYYEDKWGNPYTLVDFIKEHNSWEALDETIETRYEINWKTTYKNGNRSFHCQKSVPGGIYNFRFLFVSDMNEEGKAILKGKLMYRMDLGEHNH
jgi:hypothetical protein